MHKLTFYPIGNCDCCFIELDNGHNLLFDYAHYKISEDENEKRIDLKMAITNKLDEKEKKYFDIVTFTHADEDHINGFSDLFYLKHAKKYQSDDRIHINELWIPAAIICESNLPSEAKILQAEARYRLKNKTGIKVFSRPSMLKKWFEDEELDITKYQEYMVDAGKLVNNYNLESDNVEIFVHSPFGKNIDKEETDRNTYSIVAQLVFKLSDTITKLIMSADTTYDNWIDVVNITKNHKREDRLEWDIFKLPHHCSYQALNEEKGKEKTDPVEEVKWLLNQGNNACKIISCSDIIPSTDTEQPPHKQAANYYKEVAGNKSGEFLVTMEFPPKKEKPEPLVIQIDDNGATTIKRNFGAIGIISNTQARRAGEKDD